MNDLTFIALAAVLGTFGGFFICSLFTARKVKRAVRATWREAEKLHQARSIQDLRDNTSARIS